MGFSKWTKHAQKLAAEHSDKITPVIDKAATKAKASQPSKGSYIDKAADLAKKSVSKQ